MEFFNTVLEYTYYSPIFYTIPIYLVLIWFLSTIVSILWLYVDDRLGEVCLANKLFVFIEAHGNFSEYQFLLNRYENYSDDRSDIVAVAFATFFGFAAGLYVYPLTIVILTVYGIIRGLRFLRRLQKRVTTISDIKEE